MHHQYTSHEAFTIISSTLIVLAVFLPVYFLPWLIALGRKAKSSVGIFFLNLILGWTVVVWVVCFIWACVDKTRTNET